MMALADGVGLGMAPEQQSKLSPLFLLLIHTKGWSRIAIAVPLAAAGQALTIFVRTITVFYIHKAD